MIISLRLEVIYLTETADEMISSDVFYHFYSATALGNCILYTRNVRAEIKMLNQLPGNKYPAVFWAFAS